MPPPRRNGSKISQDFLDKCIEELTVSRQSNIASLIQGNMHFRECFEDVLYWIKQNPEEADEISSLLECETGVYIHPLRLRLLVEEAPE